MKGFRTWVEVDETALRHNAEQFLRLIPKHTRFLAVIKSNAYGHGLAGIASLLANFQFPTFDFQRRLWFGVDSIVEALRLRKEGIENPILVLGGTLPERLSEAATHQITVTISSFEALEAVGALDHQPSSHLKIDTGMCRQGFQTSDLPRLAAALSRLRVKPSGVYTHFAAAKDPADTTATRAQLNELQRATDALSGAGLRDFFTHAAATGGTLMMPDAHLDMVRIGIGLYGCWPSEELANAHDPDIILQPALTWKTIVGELKTVPAGSRIGYDGTELVERPTTIAVLPVGYWHGYDRGLSGIGEVLITGQRAKVLGRISMDMTVVDVTDIPEARYGAPVTLIGRTNAEQISAEALGERIGTTAYEIMTRINPLIRRIYIP